MPVSGGFQSSGGGVQNLLFWTFQPFAEVKTSAHVDQVLTSGTRRQRQIKALIRARGSMGRCR